MPTGGVTLDNAGDWIRAGAVAVGVGTALTRRQGDRRRRLRAAPRQRRENHRQRPSRAGQRVMSRVVTFGEIMLRLSPPGFERFLQSPVLRRDLRRRRSQRRGQPGAVRARQRVHHPPAGARDRRGGDPRAPRRRRADLRDPARRQPHRRLLRRSRRQPARLDGHLRSRALRDQRDGAGRDRLAGDHRRAPPGSTSTGITPALGAKAPRPRGARSPPRRRRRAGQRRSQLPEEALDREAGAGRSWGR